MKDDKFRYLIPILGS